MILLDKIYTDNENKNDHLLNVQNNRYFYLSDEIRSAIVDHEYQDYESRYRMDESQTQNVLKDI